MSKNFQNRMLFCQTIYKIVYFTYIYDPFKYRTYFIFVFIKTNELFNFNVWIISLQHPVYIRTFKIRIYIVKLFVKLFTLHNIYALYKHSIYLISVFVNEMNYWILMFANPLCSNPAYAERLSKSEFILSVCI